MAAKSPHEWLSKVSTAPEKGSIIDASPFLATLCRVEKIGGGALGASIGM
jgi:hypothetical protein